MHREHGAEQKSLPWKLGCSIQPTAQNEHQQVARLNEHVERWLALPAKARRVVESHREQQHGVPPKNPRAHRKKERRQKWKLDKGDLPLQVGKLFSSPQRAKQKGAFARIVAVG